MWRRKNKVLCLYICNRESTNNFHLKTVDMDNVSVTSRCNMLHYVSSSDVSMHPCMMRLRLIKSLTFSFSHYPRGFLLFHFAILIPYVSLSLGPYPVSCMTDICHAYQVPFGLNLIVIALDLLEPFWNF